ncbi:hypothetical protein CBM2599_B51040 [Cupriavidus taiwanensis]|uniref:Uncharacterized protein n=1 Tax=Cupriavidus taiwanensis TaxID=164546 RepID=A0A976AQV9_9BURK|nr:hypothetical protein CBM2599_B51040 [Cupriavidus taiwanensis]SOZ00017.1 hypothetical protein CBM2600_B70050 [Cupriavidus taiwanensis]SPD68312.1 protein of unknown function [Cupriavidus taiwanensis]
MFYESLQGAEKQLERSCVYAWVGHIDLN